MAELRRFAGSRPFRRRRAGQRTGFERLRAVGSEARRRAAAEPNADRTGGRGEDDALVVVAPEARVAPPAVDGFLEVADDSEPGRSEPRGDVVEDPEQPQRELAEPLVD